ncbi:hypothetical protein MNBD_ACTINO01-691 [hydrothermal vent metagenome]|uniref:Uncharacterized protein n=1 Tax=hydrothermal vent metagenome TaxID=652676 RepID=A0A3B0SQC3_9ZZZZ
MRDTPTSDELIKRAKRDFAPTVYSRTYTVVSRAEDIEKMVAETMNTDAIAKAMAETMDPDAMMDPSTSMGGMMSRPDEPMVPERARRMPSAPRPPVPVTPTQPVPATAYPTGFGGSDGRSGNASGKPVLRAFGLFILLALAGLWVLLIIGAVGSPDEAASILGGGVVLTAVPFIVALLLLRAARRAKPTQGIIS